MKLLIRDYRVRPFGIDHYCLLVKVKMERDWLLVRHTIYSWGYAYMRERMRLP